MGKKNSRNNSSNFRKGDRIFAKIKGFPYWPARIESLPNENIKKFKIMFYGTYQTNMIKPDSILPYNDDTKHLHGQKKQKSFIDAMWEIENDPNLKLLKKAKNSSKEKDNIEETNGNLTDEIDESTSNVKNENDEEKTDQIELNTNDNLCVQNNETETSKRAIRYSNRHNKEESDEKEQSVKVKKKSRNEKSPKDKNDDESQGSTLEPENQDLIETDFQNENLETESSSFNENRRESRQKKPNKRYVTDDNDEAELKRPKRSSKLLDEDVNQSEEKNEKAVSKENPDSIKEDMNDISSPSLSDNNSTSESDSNSVFSKEENIENSSKNSKTLKDNHKLNLSQKTDNNKKLLNKTNSNIDNSNKDDHKMIKKKIKSNNDVLLSSKQFSKQTSQDKQIAKEITEQELMKNKKMTKRKLDFINNVRIQLALLRMDFEIKKSLRVDNTDVDYCCLIMQDLIKLPIKKSHLFITPTIVDTIKKCRKFKNSEKVRETSTECYDKFCKILSLNRDETFTNEFEKEKCKYLTEKMASIKKQRSLAYKLIASDRRKTNSLANTPCKLSIKSNTPATNSNSNNSSKQLLVEKSESSNAKDE